MASFDISLRRTERSRYKALKKRFVETRDKWLRMKLQHPESIEPETVRVWLAIFPPPFLLPVFFRRRVLFNIPGLTGYSGLYFISTGSIVTTDFFTGLWIPTPIWMWSFTNDQLQSMIDAMQEELNPPPPLTLGKEKRASVRRKLTQFVLSR